MATSLLSACGISDPIKFIFIKENCDVDASFLITSLIGQRIRQQNSAIILICAHQSFSYYNLTGMKLGYNLNMAMSKNSVRVIEPMQEMYANNSNQYGFQQLSDKLNEYLKELQDQNKSNVTIILDDVQFFHTCESSYDSGLIKFANNLEQLVINQPNVSIIMKMNLSDLYDVVGNNIEDLADICLTVDPLKSGHFKEVDGKISVQKFNTKSDSSWNRKESERSLLYKINDRNIKIYAPGEFGLKC